MNLTMIFTTIDDPDAAALIARSLVERRLAACVQISEIQSIYRWDGAIQDAGEYRLVIKTTRDRYADVESLIKALHTYDLPAVVAVDAADASPGYADWVKSSTE